VNPFAREPGLKDAAGIEGAHLHNSATDKLAAADADVDSALECKQEAIGTILIGCLWDQGQNRFRELNGKKP